jgi:putative ABC transport system substrate-binding protein
LVTAGCYGCLAHLDSALGTAWGGVVSVSSAQAGLTGLSFFTNQMEAKRLGLLHELAPKVNPVAVLLNPNNPYYSNQVLT